MQPTSSRPGRFVSFIIVARNAEKFLSTLLGNYLDQDYPAELRELIFVDSMSEDRTRAIAEEFRQSHPELAMTILENPRVAVAAGWNIALQAARGEIVVRVDAHVSIPSNYLRDGVQLLEEHSPEGVVCVGGPWTTRGEGFWGQAIAAVLSSPFGVGDSPFRHGEREGIVETVPCGLYWRWVFDQVGLLREDVGRAEDNELHARIRARGWKFYLSPKLRNTYACRSTVGAFLQQAYGNGYWVMASWRDCSGRHLIPFFFVGLLGGLGLGSFFSPACATALSYLGSIYLALALYAAYLAPSELSAKVRLLVCPPLYLLLHLAYGLGSWAALIARLRREWAG